MFGIQQIMKISILNVNQVLVKRTLLALIFFVALSLRFALCYYNRQANDDHMEVVNWILDAKQVPEKKDCWECYQPKLYYQLNAKVIRHWDITDKDDRIVAAQMINFIFSFFLLVFVWAFIRNQHFSESIKLLAFSLIALNPCLVGINVQVTNDTLEILAGTMAIFFSDLFFRKWNPVYFICATASFFLAFITKGSGLTLLLGIFLVYIFQMYVHQTKLKLMIIYGATFIIAFMLIVPSTGGYYDNYKKYGNPFINNMDFKDPPPEFFHQTFTWRPGITSIVHGYFTFRIIEMVKRPYINNTSDNYPLHRTSLWSQLYGRTFFLQFDQWPDTWATLNQDVLLVGKILLVLGLVPLIIFLTGCFLAGRDLFHTIMKRKRTILAGTQHWMHLLFFASAVAFIIKYTYDYRDFSNMKSIFIFPVLVSIIALFMYGFNKIKSRIVFRLTSFLLICFGFFSALDIYYLLRHLMVQ